MGVLYWDYSIPVDEAHRRGQIISSIVQSGIKLFLHQRNQIPLPLEQLRRRTGVLHGLKGPFDLMPGHMSLKTTSPSLEKIDDAMDDPRERIKAIVSNRRDMMKHAKGQRKELKSIKQEELAHQIITNILQTLDTSITKNSDDLLAVGLIFGPSIQSLKELIVFDIPSTSDVLRQGGTCRTTSNSCLSQENLHSDRPFDMVPLVRSFYRTIIMSDEFLELTTKSLHSTQTHICLFSRSELPEDLRQDMILLERTNFLSQLLIDHQYQKSSSPSDKLLHHSVRVQPSGRKTVKVLRVKCLQSASIGGGGGMMDKNSQETNEFLLESNSFCCYQIPLRFKGVQCKSKGFKG